MNVTKRGQPWRELCYNSFDGLRLCTRVYPANPTEDPDTHPVRPVLCLAGLTRNAKDFHELAVYLSNRHTPTRTVYCPDYRGRGSSAYDSDWRNYTPLVETRDVLDFMTIKNLHQCDVIGTSRGGIIAMIMAAIRPTALNAVILNDIGPVLEPTGISRIIGYVGNTPTPSNWQEAADIIRQLNEAYFTEMNEQDWLDFAQQIFNEKDGRPAQAYDEKIATSFGQLDLTDKLPEMWPQFFALKNNPVLVLRGANSDLLSETTLERMKTAHPDCQTQQIANQGHAPLLNDTPTMGRIAAFLDQADSSTTARVRKA